eukprot:TRINITY_DN5978_c0_g4_i1.p1 TRINITY_DN5978_c0_g4~~TRINITY_DN5978_c0_g4_i1.p1  ORF type:complete len:501 (+),score=100.89 TRINITY_DN5978_c0_g4_i1:77-1504(+)
MEINASLILNDDARSNELTIDQAYEISGMHGRYQYLVAVCTIFTVFTNLFYLFFMPLFLIIPVVLDRHGRPFPDTKAACAAPYRHYEDRDFNYITQFDLLCQPFKASLIPSSFQVGVLISSLTMSNAVDYLGRVPLLIVEQAGIVISLTCVIFFNSYASCLVFTGVCGYFCFGPLFYTFAFDSNHSKYIKFYTVFIGVAYALGEIIVVFTMWIGSKWRTACVVTIIFCMLQLVSTCFVKESPRFLYSKGKLNAAIRTFKRIAKINGKPITQPFTLKDESKAEIVTTTLGEQLKLILEGWIVFRLVMCSWIFFTCGFVYYGFTLNVQKFVGDTYANALFNAIAEIVGVLLSFVAAVYWGCRVPLMGSLLITCAALLVQYFSQSVQTLNNCAMYVGKMSVSGSLTFCYMLGGELFPTSVRATCIAILFFIERVGVILSPIIGNWPNVLLIMASICSFGSSIAVVILHCGLRNKGEEK